MMKAQQTLRVGLVGLGFVLAVSAQAAPLDSLDWDAATVRPSAPGFSAVGFVVAARDNLDSRSEPRRDERDERAKNNPRPQPRDTERYNEPEPFGYGYERRQEPPRKDSDRGRH